MLHYLGPRGTHTEKAARLFGELLGEELHSSPSIYSVFEAVVNGSLGVLPSENAIEGSVTLTLDLLLRLPVRILAETSLPITHSLVGYRKESVRRVLSHPQALAQCRNYILKHGWETVSMASTSEAARFVAESGDETLAAIASEETAELYGLKVLERDVQDYSFNKTRFILVGPDGHQTPRVLGKPVKSSLFVELENVPGSLHRALGVFARRGVNLTRIESRPSLKELGYYVFYIDYETPAEEEELLKELEEHVTFLKYLGRYPLVSLSGNNPGKGY